MNYTEENTKDEITRFKKEQPDVIGNMLIDYGFLEPSITILAYDNTASIYKTVFIMIPPELMQSDPGKDMFAALAPSVLKSVAERNMIPLCFSWSSEAWIRKASIDTPDVLNNWKDLPKEEALFTYFESADSTSINCKLIIREGSKVASNGKLIDGITLKEDGISSAPGVEVKGRFTEIFKKYQEQTK